MHSEGFSIGDVFKTGYRKFSEHLCFLLSYALIFMAVSSTGHFFSPVYSPVSKWQFIGYQLALFLVNSVLGIGLVKVSLAIIDGTKLSWSFLFSGAKVLLKYVICGILFGLLVLVGFALFIIPGVYWAVKYIFSFYFVVDKGLGPVEALKESAKLTQGAKWDIFGWILSWVSLSFLGALLIGGLFFSGVYLLGLVPHEGQELDGRVALAFGVLAGLFSAILMALSNVMTAYIYRKLQNSSRQ